MKIRPLNLLFVTISTLFFACTFEDPTTDPIPSDLQAGAAGQGGSDVGQSGAGEAGVTGESCAPFPPPTLGSSKEAKDLASAPARCGQPAHVWLADPTLGTVTGSTAKSSYKSTLLGSLAAGLAGATIPKPRHDVVTSQLRYTTQDRGKLIEATAAIAMPSKPAEKPFDIVAVLHGTSGFTDGCGPSKDNDAMLLLAYVASLGYIAVGPDYLGLRGDDQKTGFPHPYLAGQPTAIASLDAIRAAGRFAEERQLCPSSHVAILGGSQGGHAALWVDRLSPYYAPELDIRGITATVPPADLLAEAQRALKEQVSASANTAAMLAVTSDWYGYGDQLYKAFVPPKDTELPQMLAASCDPGKAVDSLTSLQDVFQPALLEAAQKDALAQQQPFGCILAENGLLSTSIKRINAPSPSYGILYILGEQDTLVHTPIERASYETLCNQGIPLQFLECAGASHTKATTWALPEILAFTQARLAGEPLTPSCKATAPITCQGTPTNP